MSKILKSYRLEETTLNQIENLTMMINSKNKENGIPESSNTDIIHDAIDYYHSLKMDSNAGDSYLMKIDILVKDLMKQYMTEIMKGLNSINYSTLKNQEFISILLKTLDIPKDTDNMETVVLRKSRYEKLVDDKLMSRVSGESEN